MKVMDLLDDLVRNLKAGNIDLNSEVIIMEVKQKHSEHALRYTDSDHFYHDGVPDPIFSITSVLADKTEK